MKNIFTTKRVSFIIISIFIVLPASAAPVYIYTKLEMAFVSSKNKTILGLTFTEERIHMEHVLFALNNIFIPFSAFIIIIFCTTVIVIKLTKQSRWRKRSTATVQGDRASNRDQRVTKMVVAISSLFIICFVPVCVCFIAILLKPELRVDGNYKNTTIVFIGIGFLLESTNSSSNIFIYYKMSSKYRVVFRRLFSLNPRDKCPVTS